MVNIPSIDISDIGGNQRVDVEFEDPKTALHILIDEMETILEGHSSRRFKLKTKGRKKI